MFSSTTSSSWSLSLWSSSSSSLSALLTDLFFQLQFHICWLIRQKQIQSLAQFCSKNVNHDTVSLKLSHSFFWVALARFNHNILNLLFIIAYWLIGELMIQIRCLSWCLRYDFAALSMSYLLITFNKFLKLCMHFHSLMSILVMVEVLNIIDIVKDWRWISWIEDRFINLVQSKNRYV
jgi:hypothetical protein